MTDEQRELAEWVATWAVNAEYAVSMDFSGGKWKKRILTDDTLAFRALVELHESECWAGMCKTEDGWEVETWHGDPEQLLQGHAGDTPHEAIFRAHRAVREGK